MLKLDLPIEHVSKHGPTAILGLGRGAFCVSIASTDYRLLLLLQPWRKRAEGARLLSVVSRFIDDGGILSQNSKFLNASRRIARNKKNSRPMHFFCCVLQPSVLD